MLLVPCPSIIAAGQEEGLGWNITSSISRCAWGEVGREAKGGSGTGGAGVALHGGREKPLHGESLQPVRQPEGMVPAEGRKHH